MNFARLRILLIGAVSAALIFCAAGLFVNGRISEAEVVGEGSFSFVVPTDDEGLSFQKASNLLKDIVAKQNPTAAFNKLRDLLVKDKDTTVICHGLTHAIGKAAFEKYGSFKDAMPYNDYMCGSGYIHSLIEGAVESTNDPASVIKTICDGQDGFCYHGIGHGLFFFEDSDVPKALDLCQVLDTDEHQTRCSEGVFMQNFETGGDDEAPYLYENDPLKVCRDEARFKGACYLYGGEYVAKDWKTNVKTFAHCDKAESTYRNRCITGIGAYVIAFNLNEPKQAVAFCDGAGTVAARHACIDGVVSYYLVYFNSIPKAEAMCDTFDADDAKACRASVESRKPFYL